MVTLTSVMDSIVLLTKGEKQTLRQRFGLYMCETSSHCEILVVLLSFYVERTLKMLDNFNNVLMVNLT